MTHSDASDRDDLERAVRNALHAADSIAEPKVAGTYAEMALAGAVLLLVYELRERFSLGELQPAAPSLLMEPVSCAQSALECVERGDLKEAIVELAHGLAAEHRDRTRS
jgi:hypothetical protein